MNLDPTLTLTTNMVLGNDMSPPDGNQTSQFPYDGAFLDLALLMLGADTFPPGKTDSKYPFVPRK